jgi:hypothetical protein
MRGANVGMEVSVCVRTKEKEGPVYHPLSTSRRSDRSRPDLVIFTAILGGHSILAHTRRPS